MDPCVGCEGNALDNLEVVDRLCEDSWPLDTMAHKEACAKKVDRMEASKRCAWNRD